MLKFYGSSLCFALLACVHAAEKSTLDPYVEHRFSGEESRSGLSIEWGSGFSTFVVKYGKRVVLRAEDGISFFANNRWYSSFDESLQLKTVQNISGNDANWGDWLGTEMVWKVSDHNNPTLQLPFLTRVRQFVKTSTLQFEYNFPAGANNTSVTAAKAGTYEDASVNFPAFTDLYFTDSLSWRGSFVTGARNRGNVFATGTTAGPSVFFNTTSSTSPNLSPLPDVVIIAGPSSNFKAWSAGSGETWRGTNGSWAPGTSGTIKQIPANFSHDLVIHACEFEAQTTAGVPPITTAIYEYGQLLKSKLKSEPKISDVTLEKIGYQTDNGAMYCFCNGNCSNTLLQVHDYYTNLGIHLGYLSFQGAGASSSASSLNGGAPWCVGTWGIDGGLGSNYPLQIPEFQHALDLPLQLYAPYFCPKSEYFDSQTVDTAQGQLTWPSVKSNTSLPGCSSFDFQDVAPEHSLEFYRWFFDKTISSGMVSFEPDFMNQNYNCVPKFIETTWASPMWQQGMAVAAEERGVAVQWCYATPTDVLASMQMPSVTNFRVSFDFCYGSSWKVGLSSLLVWAAGARPSKDTLWSTDNNHTATPGCSWTPDHESVAAPLHVMLALFSTGPVGISDAIDFANATLLNRTISQKGILLQPSKPATATDSTIVLAPNTYGEHGYIFSSFSGPSTSSDAWAFYVISFKLTETQPVPLNDLWPRVSPQTSFYHRSYGFARLRCKNGTDAVKSGCVQKVKPMSLSDAIFVAPQSDLSNVTGGTDLAPNLETLWPLTKGSCPGHGSAWTFLGELDKYVAASTDRIEHLKTDCVSGKETLSATLIGSEGEHIDIYAVSPTGILNVQSIQFPSSGRASLLFQN